MANTQVSTRVPQDIVDRLDAIARVLTERDPGRPIDRGGVVRVLIMTGLPTMEAAGKVQMAIEALADDAAAFVRKVAKEKPAKKTAKRGRK